VPSESKADPLKSENEYYIMKDVGVTTASTVLPLAEEKAEEKAILANVSMTFS
jgi:hypothetical protein